MRSLKKVGIAFISTVIIYFVLVGLKSLLGIGHIGKPWYLNTALLHLYTYRKVGAMYIYYIELIILLLPITVAIVLIIVKDRAYWLKKIKQIKYNSKTSRIKRLEEEIEQLKKGE